MFIVRLFDNSETIVMAVILEPYPNSKEAAEYFKEHVQPLLLKGLTCLAKAKPASETYGAVVSS